MAPLLPRGIRNNNPGNIRKTEANKWLGEWANGDDPLFETFETAALGIRALARILIGYRDRAGLGTVRQMVGRWAPPNENDTGAYVRHVADRLGVGPDDPVDVHDAAILVGLVKAIIAHENSNYAYPPAVVAQGVGMALGTGET